MINTTKKFNKTTGKNLVTLLLIPCFVLFLLTPLLSTGTASAQSNPEPNLTLKRKAFNYCAKVYGFAVEDKPSKERIDQSGRLSTPCAKGYFAGFFGNKSKKATCNINEPVTNPFDPTDGTNPNPGDPIGPENPTDKKNERICKKAYDQGKSIRSKTINQQSKASEDVCNKTEQSKRKKCRQQLNKCRNKPSKQKLACFQKLASNYPPASNDTSDTDDIDCQGGFGLGWIICPIFELGANMTNDVFNKLIKPMMTNVPVSASGGFYNAWQGFRILANIIMVMALLIMVLAQAVGRSSVADAYMIRKMAPRILIGVIAINLSIYLCIVALDVTNIVGGGLSQLISAPFDLEKLKPDGGASNVAGILIILAALISGSIVLLGQGGAGGLLGLLLIMILTIMLIVLSIMLILAFRQSLLVLLTILSPVAMALFILPSTEKYFRQWWDLFLRALIMYPIVAALFAVSGVLATINFESTTINPDNLQGAFNIIMGLILIFIPLFMIPFAFKMSGGVLGQATNAANGMRTNFANWNRQRLDRAGQNPDSRLARGNRAVKQRASNAQFSAREGIARRRPGSAAKRAERLNKLAGLREGKNAAYAAEAGQGTYAKATAQIDEAQLDMARYGSSAQSLEAIRNGTHISMGNAVDAAAQRIYGGKRGDNGQYGNDVKFNDLSATEKARVMGSGDEALTRRQNQLRMYSAMNDQVGRGTATRAAAAKSGAALAYGYAEGEEGWGQAVDIARDVFNGNESQMLSHMNELQYVATQAGRSDLSGNVNSLEYDPLRAAGKTSGAAAMGQEKPQTIRSRINESIGVLNNNEATYKQKLQAVQRIADLRAGGSSPYATNANKDVLNAHSGAIDQAVKGFFGDSSMQQQAAAAEQSTDTSQHAENIFKGRETSQGGTRTVRDDKSGDEFTVPIRQEVSGADAAQHWFNQQSGRQLSQSEIEAQQQQQGQQEQNQQENE